MQRFARPKQATFDASGTATAAVSAPAGMTWHITITTVSTTSTAVTTASVYLGSPSPGTFIEGTYDGNGDSSDTQHTVLSSETLTCVWTGGTPGAIATFRVSGMQG